MIITPDTANRWEFGKIITYIDRSVQVAEAPIPKVTAPVTMEFIKAKDGWGHGLGSNKFRHRLEKRGEDPDAGYDGVWSAGSYGFRHRKNFVMNWEALLIQSAHWSGPLAVGMVVGCLIGKLGFGLKRSVRWRWMLLAYPVVLVMQPFIWGPPRDQHFVVLIVGLLVGFAGTALLPKRSKVPDHKKDESSIGPGW